MVVFVLPISPIAYIIVGTVKFFCCIFCLAAQTCNESSRRDREEAEEKLLNEEVERIKKAKKNL
jgi:hypothetical protein